MSGRRRYGNPQLLEECGSAQSQGFLFVPGDDPQASGFLNVLESHEPLVPLQRGERAAHRMTAGGAQVARHREQLLHRDARLGTRLDQP